MYQKGIQQGNPDLAAAIGLNPSGGRVGVVLVVSQDHGKELIVDTGRLPESASRGSGQQFDSRCSSREQLSLFSHSGPWWWVRYRSAGMLL